MKQKKELAFLAVLVVILGYVGWYLLHSVEQVNQGPNLLNMSYAPLGVESPAPRDWEMEDSRKAEYSKAYRNIFSVNVPPPVEPQKTDSKAPERRGGDPYPLKPPPPTPPTLPVTFFGYGTIPNGTARRAFLTNHEDIFIVGEGDTLLGRFRILKINNATIEFEEISTGLRNTSPLVIEEAGASTSPAPQPPPVS